MCNLIHKLMDMPSRFAKIFWLLFLLLNSCQSTSEKYKCPPCNMSCDERTFAEAGNCPHCNMELMLNSELEAERNALLNEIKIQEGSGVFLIEGIREKAKPISIFYHKPKNFTKNSNVLLVLPGAGRNGRTYRNAWKEASEKHNVLILSLQYSEEYYPEFWNYNLGGMIYDVAMETETYKVHQDPKEWIFGDFDRIFKLVKTQLDLTTDLYDMFGHSAGGQVLHRLAIFYPNTKANRILAANSGWYTIPSTTDIFPYGLRNIREAASRLDFSKNLVVFLGEKDDANETRGELRRSPKVDIQGLGRLSRGQYFYQECQKIAIETNQPFNWNLEIVPNVGHDFKAMSQHAAEYLYGMQ